MKPGDIVLIRFPQADLQAGKLRPALVVAIAPGRHADILLAMITSRLNQALPDFDEIIASKHSDFSRSGLKVPSVVRLARLTTVEAAVINARLGEIASRRLETIRNRLVAWLQT